jgi:hypothetical protein
MAEHGLQVGTPELVSVGDRLRPRRRPLRRRHDPGHGAAIDVAEESADADASTGGFDLDDLGAKLASFLGCADDDVAVRPRCINARATCTCR